MPRAMSRTACRTCGQQVSTNGLAKASHARKHVREGLLVEIESNYWADGQMQHSRLFVAPTTARRYLDNEPGVGWRVIAGTPAPASKEN